MKFVFLKIAQIGQVSKEFKNITQSGHTGYTVPNTSYVVCGEIPRMIPTKTRKEIQRLNDLMDSCRHTERKKERDIKYNLRRNNIIGQQHLQSSLFFSKGSAKKTRSFLLETSKINAKATGVGSFEKQAKDEKYLLFEQIPRGPSVRRHGDPDSRPEPGLHDRPRL